MAFRFRRSIRIAPGVRINLSKGGASLSAGVRGASVSVGKRGVYGNVGLPGTGVSYRQRLDTGAGAGVRSTRGSQTPLIEPGTVQLSLEDDGSVAFSLPDGTPLPPRLVKATREAMGTALGEWLEEQCEEHWNHGIQRLLRVHEGTPSPTRRPGFEATPFAACEPVRPMEQAVGFFGMLWPPRRERIEDANRRSLARFEDELKDWREQKSAHESVEEDRRRAFEAAQAGQVEAMHDLLADRFASVDLPWDSGVSFEITEDGRRVWIDLDLPEVEDLPKKEAKVATRGVRINVKDRSDTQIRREYAALVHAIAFRVAGEAFFWLPLVQEVILAAYSQRVDAKTAQIGDEYLLSARVQREEWETADFTNLSALDVVATFERFDLVRSMTKTGIFRPITPHER